MENITEKKSVNRNVFKKLNFVRGNKINYNYLNAIHKIENFSGNCISFFEYINNSIEKDMLSKGKFTRFFSKLRKNNDLLINPNLTERIGQKNKNSTNFLVIPKLKKIKKNNIYKKKGAKSLILVEKNKREINKYHQKSYSTLRKSPNLSNSSMILNNSTKRTLNPIKTKNKSVSNSKENEGNNSSKYKIYNFIKNKMINEKITNSQSDKSTDSINEHNPLTYRPKNYRSINNSKYSSISLYKPFKHFFSNYKSKLMPEYLMKFAQKAKKIKDSYEKDFIINLANHNKKLLEIAEDEINMKDPEYHKKQIFKNVLEVKKTLKYVRKMRAEKKSKVKYLGPGNINNETIIRTKNANLLRFCDSICHMKDDKFYEYRTMINKFYPTLSKGAFKNKYDIPQKDYINEKKCNDNLLEINRLFLLIQKNK